MCLLIYDVTFFHTKVIDHVCSYFKKWHTVCVMVYSNILPLLRSGRDLKINQDFFSINYDETAIFFCHAV